MATISEMTIHFDLRQKHVDVDDTRVAEGLIADIHALALAEAKKRQPGASAVIINTAPPHLTTNHEISLCLFDPVIEDAEQKKSNKPFEGRKQRDHAWGRATYRTIVRAWDIPPETLVMGQGLLDGIEEWAVIRDKLAKRYREKCIATARAEKAKRGTGGGISPGPHRRMEMEKSEM